jgi:N-glycosylase/DNA lyase
MKEKADAAIEFVHACECYKGFIKDSKSAKAVYRQLNRRIARVNELADEINDLYKQLEQKQNKRQIIINAVKRYKTKKTK